jgi:hypothetical protein
MPIRNQLDRVVVVYANVAVCLRHARELATRNPLPEHAIHLRNLVVCLESGREHLETYRTELERQLGQKR